MKSILLIPIFFCALLNQSIAQCGDPDIYCMNTGLVYTCNGTFMDAGGDDVYPSVSAALTFCSDSEGNKVSITFSDFDLYGGLDFPDSDQVIVFDGTSENDPLVGIYSGSDLAGVTVSASNGNPSGCLLIQFISGGSPNTSHTGWVAEVSCEAACPAPLASASVTDAIIENGIYLNCIYDEITLSGAGSTPAPGHEIVSYEWDLMDGNTQTSTTEDIVHLYGSPAIYDVILTVFDETGCAGETSIHVGMMGAPALDIPDAQAVCVGSEISLNASFTPASINNAPQLENSIALFVPDDQTQSFQTEILVSGYQAGAFINSCDDLESVRVNMEHSFVSDLAIVLICPSGQSVVLHEQGGGGVYLGEPVDFEDTTPGVGYDYYWSDNSTNDTWAGAAMNAGVPTLPAGTYAPVEPLCNLMGCPLNGIWALNVTDLVAADNGYVFSWGLGMAVGNNVEALVYTSQIDQNASASYWSGSDILTLSEDADEISINTNEFGPLDLSYTTIDNLGCTFTEQLALDVIENPFSIVLDDYFTYDANNTSIIAFNNGSIDESLITWSWTPADGLENPGENVTQVLLPNDNETYTVTASSDGYLGCSDSQTIALTLPELTLTGHIFLDANQNGIFDSEEQALPFFPYFVNNNSTISFSDQNGYYSAYCEYGSNTVSFDVDPSLWVITTPSSYTTTIDDGQTESINNDFGIYPSSNPQTNIVGSISNSNTWCVLNDVQTITVSNEGNTIESGYVVYTYDPSCTLISSNPAPYNIEGNNLYFSYENLFYSSTESFEITLDMPDNAAGQELNFVLQSFYYEGEVAMPLGTDPLVTTVVCSYDPNDKREFNGDGEMGMIAPNSTLDYVIRFQNTGNAPALDVVIVDQLPASLNFSSLNPVSASHAFTVSVNAQGLATFNFDNIMLPDSSTDFDGSIGYIHFRIDQNADLPLGTIIHNNASIYFDMNEPIVTNNTTNTIMICTDEPLDLTLDEGQLVINDLVSDVHWYVDGELLPNAGYMLEIAQNGSYYAEATLANGCPAVSSVVVVIGVSELNDGSLEVFPNPASDYLTLRLPDSRNNVFVINYLGQTVKQIFNVSGNFQMNLADLPRGVYTISAENVAGKRNTTIVLE